MAADVQKRSVATPEMSPEEYVALTKKVSVGKKVRGDVYVHASAVPRLPAPLRELLEAEARDELENGYNVVKFHRGAARISLLSYPRFRDDAFPALAKSLTVDLVEGKRQLRTYKQTGNPPILHRKETLLPADDPDVPQLRELTEAVERAGLFADAGTIGRRRAWEKRLEERGFIVKGHELVATGSASDGNAARAAQPVARYRTAIKRHGLSVPVQALADHGFLDGQYTLFDYGCGRGDDVRVLQANGVDATGWDPNFRPDQERIEADVVNLGFVLNVIEDPRERREALRGAFGLARRVLVASVMIAGRATIDQFEQFGDGVITKRNTFQKYFSQSDFRTYLESTLGAQPIALGPGVFFVFKDALDEQVFLLERQKSRRRPLFVIPEASDDTDEKRRAVLETNKDLLTAYWQRCLDLGRQAKPAEFDASLAVRRLFGSYKQAFSFLVGYFGKDKLEQARRARTDDLLVYFALREFEQRKAYKHLPDVLKRDVKEYFGIYRSAKQQAMELLFSCGRPDVIATACEQANADGLGYLDEGHSLYLHSSQINELPAVLRVYVGCATQLYGDVDRADLVKLHMRSGKVSLMIYDDFDGKPVPLLRERIKIRLRDQLIDFFDYTGEFEPQPLYLRSRFLPADYPRRDEQERFDDALVATELFDLSGFGPGQKEFEDTLSDNQLKIKGFRMVRG